MARPDIREVIFRLSVSHPRFAGMEIVSRGGVWSNSMPCPFHEDSSPSFAVNLQANNFHCFGCGVKGTSWDLIGMAVIGDEYDRENWSAFQGRILDWWNGKKIVVGNFPPVKIKPKIPFARAAHTHNVKQWHEKMMTYEFKQKSLMEHFGINGKTAHHFMLGHTGTDMKAGAYISIPYFRLDGILYGVNLRYAARKVPDQILKYYKMPGSDGLMLYNGRVIAGKPDGSRLFIVEDEWSVMALWQLGQDAVAYPASTGARGSLREEWMKHLVKYECVVIPDRDKTGILCARMRVNALRDAGGVATPMVLPVLDGVKDFADLARMHPDIAKSTVGKDNHENPAPV